MFEAEIVQGCKSNWIRVGQTTGRTRQSQRQRDPLVPASRKDIYRYPLVRHVRQALRNGATITSHFLGADRVIPIGQRRVSAEVNLAHLRVRDGLALFIMLVC